MEPQDINFGNAYRQADQLTINYAHVGRLSGAVPIVPDGPGVTDGREVAQALLFKAGFRPETFQVVS